MSSQTKLDAAAKVNFAASEKGFAKSEKDAVAIAMKNCAAPTLPKWQLKLSAQGPFIQQRIDKDSVAYGPYQVVCFKSAIDGAQLKLSTTHQGGGYGKAYYVLPMISLFAKDLSSVPLGQKFDFKQDRWSGDYQTTLVLPIKRNEIYYLVVAADNRHPELNWAQYTNPGLGFMLQGTFPIEVRSSPDGIVKAEIVPAI